MQVRADVRALRADDTPQRAAQAELFARVGEWRSEAGTAAVLQALEAFGHGAPLASCPALASLFRHGSHGARELVDGFVATALGGLRRSPLAQVPLRHSVDALTSNLLLAQAGRATLSLLALDGTALPRSEPTTVTFSSHHSWEMVLAGSATTELVDAPAKGGSPLLRKSLKLETGTVLVRDAKFQALVYRRIDGCLVSLRLQRRASAPEPVNEHALDDGRLLRQAGADPRESRHELMLALLGRMGRSDAAPIMADLAAKPGSMALRWQAVRECLALDTARGFETLCRVARSADDPLAPAAGALRAQLIETHPVLAELASEPCPA